MKTIYYTSYGKETMELFAPEIKRSLGSAARGLYLECPAVKDFNKNVFTVFSPFNVKFTFNRETNNIHITGDNVLIKAQYASDGSVEIQFYPQLIFRSDEKVMLQLLPPVLTNVVHQGYVPTGEYDISRWLRPVHAALIVPNTVNELEIKEGDALFSLRFATDESVKLVKKDLTAKEEKLTKACEGVSDVKRGNKLETLYRLFDIMRGKRCPFR